MARYRSVVLGCVGRARRHVEAYKLIDRARVVACADRIPELREKFAAQYGLKAYAEAAEMIEKEKPDLIHVVTRPSWRVEILRMVSDLEVPACIVEKPIATEARDWKALCDLESKTKTKIGVGAQFRYHPNLGRCREALATGRLGKVLFMESTAGSTICDQGVHVLDWAMSLINDSPVVRVFGAASGAEELSTKHPSPNDATAQLVFANGVHCLWTLGSTAPRVPTVYEAIGRFSHCRVAAYCERGRTLFEEFGKWEIVSGDGVESWQNTSREDWIAGNDAAQASLTNAMLDWLEDDSRPAGTHFKRSLEQWNAILGLYASAVYRKPIDIPFDPPDDLFQRLTEALQKAS